MSNFDILTNTFSTLDRYILQFGQIHVKCGCSFQHQLACCQIYEADLPAQSKMLRKQKQKTAQSSEKSSNGKQDLSTPHRSTQLLPVTINIYETLFRKRHKKITNDSTVSRHFRLSDVLSVSVSSNRWRWNSEKSNLSRMKI